MKRLISVLTPIRNGETFVADAIKSVTSQEADFEHLIIDGASTDGTLEVVRGLAHSRLRLTSEPDRGQSDALNKGLAASTGDIVAWLNCDERFTDKAFAIVRRFFDEHPDVNVVYGDEVRVTAQGAPIRLLASHRPSRFVLRNYGCFIPTCSTFIRRSALPSSPWDTQLRWIMDWDLFLRLDRDGHRFAHLPEPLAEFLVHPGQVTQGIRSEHEHEWARVRARYGVRLSNHHWATRRPGQVAHALLKAVDGAYSRERRFRKEVGGPRWRGAGTIDQTPSRQAEGPGAEHDGIF